MTAERPEPRTKVSSGTAEVTSCARQTLPACNDHAEHSVTVTMEEVLSRSNLLQAYHRVVGNKGAAGVDGMTVDELWTYCQHHWERHREELELERRGHKFVRYADDCNIYVRSRRAGERVLDGVQRFLSEKLRLTVNRAKSAVDRPWNRKFLGYTFTHHHQPKFKVSPESVKRFKGRLREELRKARGRSVRTVLAKLQPVLIGWVSYYRKSEVKQTFEDLDQWLRRKLRAIYWRQWKRPAKRARELIRLGIDRVRAWVSVNNGHGPWWNAGASHMNQALPTRSFTQLGLISLVQQCHELNRPLN